MRGAAPPPMAWVGWTLGLLGVATIAGAGLIAVHAKRNLATWNAVIAFVAFGSTQVFVLLFGLQPEVEWHGQLYAATWLLASAATIGFAIAYPGHAIAPARRWAA